MFHDIVDRIYQMELEVKNTTDTSGFASCLILLFEIHSEDRLRTELYDKRDHFNFAFICSNIPAVPAYEVYISRLIRYFRAFVSYNDFLNKELLLTRKQQWFLGATLKSSLRKLTVTEHLYFVCHNHNPYLSLS